MSVEVAGFPKRISASLIENNCSPFHVKNHNFRNLGSFRSRRKIKPVPPPHLPEKT